MLVKNVLKICSLALLLLALPVKALQPITDAEMSDITGQAFITVSTSSHQQNGLNYEFTKVNIGAIIETLFNADLLKIGEFERTADNNRNGDGTVRMADANGNPISGGIYDQNNNGVYDADIIIENFALGHVEYDGLDYEDILLAAQQEAFEKPDAKNIFEQEINNNYNIPVSNSAHVAEIVPFLIENPYLEIAQVVDGADERVAGVRLGLGKAKGYLSGDLISLTGVIEGELTGEDVEGQIGSGFLAIGLRASFDTPFALLDGTAPNGRRGDGADKFNNANYLKRASWFGAVNDTDIPTYDVEILFGIPFFDVTASSSDCVATLVGVSVGITTCFPSTNFRTIYIGDDQVGGSVEDQLANGAATGTFISLQTENVPWEDLAAGDGSRVNTELGAFLNIPTTGEGANTSFPIELIFQDAELGLPRISTCVARLKGC